MSTQLIPLGAYDLLEVIGEGGMGVVWRGSHRALEVPVAVKVISARYLARGELAANFAREVQSMAALQHPAITRVFDHGEVDAASAHASAGRLTTGTPYLVMEHADGGALPDVVAREPLGWREVRRVLVALLDGLSHAHARGLVHRDIKPDNVLAFRRDDGWAWKLSDFGVVHSMETSRPGSSGNIAGTPLYMAPEQIQGAWRDFVPATDLYALGCLTYELVSGRPLFVESQLTAIALAHLSREPDPLLPLISVPDGFEAWVRRLLEKQPLRRFLRGAHAKAALLALGDPPAEVVSDRVELPAPGRTTVARAWCDDARTLVDTMPVEPLGHPRHDGPPIDAMTLDGCGNPPVPEDWRGEGTEAAHDLVVMSTQLYGLRTIPLVGRDEERDALWRALGSAFGESQARCVVLEGPSGCGKSRLAGWLCQRMDELGLGTYMRAVHSPAAGLADGPGAMFARYMRCGGLGSEEIKTRFRKQILQHGLDETWQASVFSKIVQETAEDYDHGSTSQGPDERAAVMRDFLRTITAWRPCVVWVEDLQWGSEALGLLTRLFSSGSMDSPVLFVATVQSEARAQLPEMSRAIDELVAMDRVETVSIASLSQAASIELTRTLLSLDEDLVRQVARNARGNPLYAIQLVDEWVQRGHLEMHAGRFALRDGVVPEIPDSLHEVWADRLRALLTGRPPADAGALQLAAVLGSRIDGTEWLGICAAAGIEPSADLVSTLVSAGLARWVTGGWELIHGMLHESSLRLMRELGQDAAAHRHAADYLSGVRASGRRGLSDRIGRHLLAAGEHEAALVPLLSGARFRSARGDYATALELLDLRADACRSLGRPDGEDAILGWLQSCSVLGHLGRFDDADALAERAERRALELSLPERVAFALSERCRSAIRRGRFPEANRLARSAHAAYLELGSVPGTALCRVGDCAAYLGELDEAALAYRQARTVFEAEGDEPGVAWSQYGLGHVHQQRECLDEARACFDEAYAILLSAGATSDAFRLLVALGDIDRHQNRLDEATDKYGAAISYFEATGHVSLAVTALNQSYVHFANEDYAAALEWTDRVSTRLAVVEQEHLAGAVAANRVALAALERDWHTWDEQFALLPAWLDGTGVVERDDAWMAELGAKLTKDAGDGERAARLLGIAARLWSRLGRAEDVARVEESSGWYAL